MDDLDVDVAVKIEGSVDVADFVEVEGSVDCVELDFAVDIEDVDEVDVAVDNEDCVDVDVVVDIEDGKVYVAALVESIDGHLFVDEHNSVALFVALDFHLALEVKHAAAHPACFVGEVAHPA